MNIDNIGNAQVTQVGFDFVPSSETNAEINRLMGYESGVFGEKVLRRFPDDYSDWETSPDYINNDDVVIELLESAGITVFVLPAHDIDKRKKVSKKKTQWIGAFAMEDELYVTVPLDKEEHVPACIWWFVLSLYHYMQTGEGNLTLVRA